jgi:hypothetical protein
LISLIVTAPLFRSKIDSAAINFRASPLPRPFAAAGAHASRHAKAVEAARVKVFRAVGWFMLRGVAGWSAGCVT